MVLVAGFAVIGGIALLIFNRPYYRGGIVENRVGIA